ncbi:phage tail protein I [Marinobacterium stanieri]|uniref:Phage tail protein, P2 protein I family n=1 Tax=Marinobacterium stanieri TaxID=49186 RepID=A0A1N6Q2Z7_9GAMM|nr:phage tail protein I [Marinobacterium stanieri]SIQ10907.1 phage tail protein, P2 protein I family [Marinobacterium stanieri]
MSSLLPPNSTSTEHALDDATARLGSVASPLRDLWNPHTCPEPFLPWLAWAYSVDTWSDAWSTEQKRQVLAASYSVHRSKGTRYALQQALNSLGYSVEVIEWFEDAPKAEPYTFRLVATINQTPMASLSLYRSLIDVANATKNVRSHLTSVALEGNSQAYLYVGALFTVGETITLAAEAP